jgi:16S rRNA G966 N2-methylase RsmD
VIFADPPYDHQELAKLPDLVMSTNILAEGGIFILEHPRSYDFSAHQAFTQHRKYGGVNFTLFSKKS